MTVEAVIDAHARQEPLVLPTSGTTTGESRAVLRSTDSWWSSFEAYSHLSGVTARSQLWIPGPLRATMNLFAAVHATVVGAVLTTQPHEATHVCLTPSTLARRLDELPAGAQVVVAGAALPVWLRDGAVGKGLNVGHYYGAAELSFVACGAHSEDLTAFPGVEIDVREGEIWARSPYLASGYAHGTGLLDTGPLRFDSDGWATVGDRGLLARTRLTVSGRPDYVQTAGATVWIADVEQALAAVATDQFAVLGVPHPTMGQVIGVVVTSEQDRQRLGEVARSMEASHRPRLWRVCPDLPETPAGKLDRSRLQSLFGTIS